MGMMTAIQITPGGGEFTPVQREKIPSNFCALHGVRPMIETLALADVSASYERMIGNKAGSGWC
jgi:hypothetical protein